jgi:transposase InsO family protein
MPWKVTDAMSERSELVKLMQQEGANVSELCRRYGVSRKAAYKWLERAQAGESLADRSRRPKGSPRRTPAKLEAQVVELRRAHPAWGGRKLRKYLQAHGTPEVPAVSTFTGILHRHDLIGEKESEKHVPVHRFEHPEPNDLWQMDFKGHFSMDRGRCHPLTVLDDHARFNISLKACGDEQTRTVREHLTEAFRRYGMPKRMLMDNGSPWGDDGTHPFTPLTVWLLHLGIAISHGRPYHPQTQGKDERFHRTLKAEVLAGRSFRDLAHCQHRFDAWRELYNEHRPHEALSMEVPASRYRISPRTFPEQLPEIVYAPDVTVRKVQDHGRVYFERQTYRLPKAFKGYPLGIRRTVQESLVDILFGRHHILSLDLQSGIATKPVTHVSAHL